eukprot:m.14781 g.14781  ORF g.14781 m.14781 type:complete len:806 (+) comp25976_c0_seq4:13-2430(+)
MASPSCSVVCADCSAPDPKWTIINKGVLVCDECCSVHRLLGRHISDLRSLTRSLWPPTLLEMITSLAGKGANSIWEHTLMDTEQARTDKAKPKHDDRVHPTKFDFVIAKYKHLAFVHRLPAREDDHTAVEDLSKQLHASVRSSNLETCLRLLFLGAEVNYFHSERGNCPLHVAASAGQSLQAELLVCYGGDPCKLDSRGHTPVECARIAGYHELADRLIECQYELTDRLTFYVCGRRPDHSSGEHYIMPSLEGKKLEIFEAQTRLCQLKNSLFEKLAADVYDEVDRRETDAVWLATQNHSMLVSDHHTMPFLPVNPAISSTRNQGRQKLATFTSKEFATLILDILVDAKRRQTLSQEKGGKMDGTVVPMDIVEAEDWDHDYDEVPDMIMIPEKRSQQIDAVSQSQSEDDLNDKEESPAAEKERDRMGLPVKNIKEVSGKPKNVVENSVSRKGAVSNSTGGHSPKGTSSKQNSLSETSQPPSVSYTEHAEVCRKLEAVQARIKQLTKVNEGMVDEIKLLQSVNLSLRQKQRTTSSPALAGPPLQPPPQRPLQRPPLGRTTTAPAGGLSKGGPGGKDEWDGPSKIMEEDEEQQVAPPPSKTSPLTRLRDHSQEEAPALPVKKRSLVSSMHAETPPPPSLSQASLVAVSQRKGHRQSSPINPTFPSPKQERERKGSLPASSFKGRTQTRQSDVVQQTEKITKRIQELLLAAQHGQQAHFVPCSRRISAAVNDMIALFPQRPESESIRASLRLLVSSVTRLQEECKAVPSNGGAVEESTDIACLTQQVIQSAYDIAMAAKQLVTHVGEL